MTNSECIEVRRVMMTLVSRIPNVDVPDAVKDAFGVDVVMEALGPEGVAGSDDEADEVIGVWLKKLRAEALR